jgi:hypothetical protein
MSHWGIELRISMPTGVLVQTNSDLLYLRSKYDQGTAEDSWHEILPSNNPLGLVIETRAVELPDDYPDDDPND